MDGADGAAQVVTRGLRFRGFVLEPFDLLPGAHRPVVVEQSGRVADGAVGGPRPPPVVERPLQEVGETAGVLGGAGPRVIGPGHGFPQPRHGTADVAQIRPFEGGEPAQPFEFGGVAFGPCGEEGANAFAVRAACGENLCGRDGPRVAGAPQFGEDRGCQVGDLLLAVLDRLEAGSRLLVGLGELLQAEDLGESVMEGGHGAVDHGAEFAVREERPVQRELLRTDDLAQLSVGQSWPVDRHPRVAQPVAVPAPADGDGCVGPVATALHLHAGSRRIVQIPPSLPPDLSTVLPAEVVARQCHLGGLGEAGLTGAVASGDHGEARCGGEAERGLRADASPPGGRDGAEEERTGSGGASGLSPGEEVAQQIRRLRLQAGGGQALEDEVTEGGVGLVAHGVAPCTGGGGCDGEVRTREP